MSKFELLKNKLLDYYRNNQHSLQIFIEVVKNRSTVVSLRLLDWFVTNYVSAFSIPDETPQDKLIRQQLYFIYAQNINSYNKVWFDPFAREAPDKGSFKIYFDTVNVDFLSFIPNDFHENIIATTIGQLNFFRCIIDYKLIDYVFEHHENIQNHMNQGLLARRKLKADENSNIYRPMEYTTNNVYNLPQNFAHEPSVHFTIQKKL